MLRLNQIKTIIIQIAAMLLCAAVVIVIAYADEVSTENQAYNSLHEQTTNDLSKEDDLLPIEQLIDEVNKGQSELQVSQFKQDLRAQLEATPQFQEAQYQLKLEAIVSYAKSFVGNPYVWGGNSLTQGCDCSHFVWLVLRDTIGYSEGWTKSTLWLNRGTVVSSLANAQAGDVIVYSGHVALYDGNGYLIEALNRHKGIVHERKADCTNYLGIRRFV